MIEYIHLAAAEGAPMRSVSEARVVAGRGLEGDRYALGIGHYSNDAGTGRHLTLIEAEVLEALSRDNGIALSPGSTRRNVTTRGIALNTLVGRRFRIGEVTCEGMRLCEPCEYLVSLTGERVLRPLVHRGGLRAEIRDSGIIRIGDPVVRLDDP